MGGVSDIRLDTDAKRIDFDITFASGSRFTCPSCGAEGQPVHDTRQRTWQHLHFFEHQAYIHAAVPRVRCQDCGKTTQVKVPWARSGSGFSQLFEAMVITLCQQMPVQKVAAYFGIGDDPIWRILDHYVETARAIAHEVFDGNVAETSTLALMLERLLKRFALQGIVVVADRGF